MVASRHLLDKLRRHSIIGESVWRLQNSLVLCCVCSGMSKSLQPHGLQLARLFCPWSFPGKNTWVVCHFLLQEICPTQGWNLRLLHWQADSLQLNHLGRPKLGHPPILQYLCFHQNSLPPQYEDSLFAKVKVTKFISSWPILWWIWTFLLLLPLS